MAFNTLEIDRRPFQIMLSSAIASISSSIFTNPIEVRKINQQMIPITCPQYPQKCSTIIQQCLCNSNTLKHQFFSGLSIVVPQTLISSAIYIQLYEFLRNIMINNEFFKSKNTLATAISAGFSRFVVSTVLAPAQAKRVRMSSKSQRKIKLSMKQRYSSFKLTVQRDVINSTICWTIVQQIRNLMAGKQEYRNKQKSNSQVWALNLVPGFIGGFICSIITNPIDVIKTRIQSKFLTSRSTWSQLKRIYYRQGTQGLFLGVHMRVLKSSVYLALYLSIYERFLNSLQHNKWIH